MTRKSLPTKDLRQFVLVEACYEYDRFAGCCFRATAKKVSLQKRQGRPNWQLGRAGPTECKPYAKTA